MEFINLNNTSKNDDLPKPPGLQKKCEDFEEGSQEEKKQLLLGKAWQIAISPISGFFMYFILFYFMGGSLNIYTIIMYFGVVISHLKNIFQINDRFSMFKQYNMSELGFYKLIYLGANVAILGFIAYKFSNMGLLPLSPSDYVDLLPQNSSIEKVYEINQ